MGCHTWFYRPLTKEEFENMKKEAPAEIEEILGENSQLEHHVDNKMLYDLLMRSYNENIPCVYGQFWWQLGWGGRELYPTEIHGETGLFTRTPEFSDIFRVMNYPRKVIHSRRELRRWMRKRYFDLTAPQRSKVSEFFKKYPGGVIIFG